MFCTTCRFIPRTTIFDAWIDELIENAELDIDTEFHFIFGIQDDDNKLYLLYTDKPNKFDKYLIRIKCYEVDPKMIPYDTEYIFDTSNIIDDYYDEVSSYIVYRFKPFKVLYKRLRKLDLTIVYEDDE